MIRNGYIDFLKGIAMFWVIFAHAIQYGSGMDFLGRRCIGKILYLRQFILFICLCSSLLVDIYFTLA